MSGLAPHRLGPAREGVVRLEEDQFHAQAPRSLLAPDHVAEPAGLKIRGPLTLVGAGPVAEELPRVDESGSVEPHVDVRLAPYDEGLDGLLLGAVAKLEYVQIVEHALRLTASRAKTRSTPIGCIFGRSGAVSDSPSRSTRGRGADADAS